MPRRRPDEHLREAALAGALAAVLTPFALWLGPPGTDFAAHLYQRLFFLEHGLALWNNFWYAGRYSFVTYSLLYYPVAAVVGLRALALLSVVAAAGGFSLLVGRQWGKRARPSSRAFAVLWPATVFSATFPFTLGTALALHAGVALQRGRKVVFALLALLTLAASPLAFAFLALGVASAVPGVRAAVGRLRAPALVVLCGLALELALFRMFPGGGRYAFALVDFLPAVAFAGLGILATRRVDGARALRALFVLYGLACAVFFVVPSELGGNLARLKYAALPLALLAIGLRGWRPLRVAVPLAAVAAVWNLAPVAGNVARAAADPSAEAAYWRPAVEYLSGRLDPSYRVEVVDTADHWGAAYLPAAGIPLVRGWYRQDDFPANAILYGPFGAKAYLAWLRRLGVRYVVLTDAPPDYSARAEAALLRSGRSGLRRVLRTARLAIFEVPGPRPIVTGPARARVLRLEPTRVLLEVGARGRYRVAIRHSPYLVAAPACISRGRDGMLRIDVPRAGLVEIDFEVRATRALQTLAGIEGPRCASSLR